MLSLILSVALYAQDPSAALYKGRCAICHNDTMPRAPSLDAMRTGSAESILVALTSGAMRVQGAKLSGPERRAVAEYITGKKIAGDATGSSQGRCKEGSAFTGTTGWNGWGGSPSNARFVAESRLTAADLPKLQLKWAFGYPDANVAWAQPSVVGNRVFVGSQNGTVFSLDAKTGCIHWTFTAKGGVRTGVSVTQSVVFFADTNAMVYALEASTGKTLWTTQVDDHPSARVTGSPTLFEDRLYVPVSSYEEAQAAQPDYECCTFRGSMVALDIRTGKVIWKTYTIAENPKPRGKNAAGKVLQGPSGAAIWSAPTVDPRRRLIYAGTGNTYTDPPQPTSDAILAFDMATGKIKWTKQATPNDTFIIGCRPGSANANCPEKNGPDFDFGSPPILTRAGGRDILIASQKSGVGFALDPDKNGEILWQYRAGEGGALGGMEWGSAVDGRYAYFPVSDITRPKPGGLHAVDLVTGKRVWFAAPAVPACGTERGCNAAQSTAATVIPGVVFAGSNDGVMRGYSTENGTVIWQYDTNRAFETLNGVAAKGGSIQGPGPAVVGGMIFFNSGYGAFGGRAGNVLLAFAVKQD